MKQLYIFLFVLLITNECCSKVDTSVAIKQLQDFDIFIGSLKEGHGGMYYSISPANFKSKVDSVRNTIKENTSREAFFLKLRFLVTLLCHGHSRIVLPESRPINFRMAVLDSNALYIPLTIQIINGKIFVLEDCSLEQTIPKGAEIKSINAHSGKQLITMMRQYMPAEGVNTSFKDYNLYNYFYFHFLYSLLFPNEKIFNIIFEGSKNSLPIYSRKPNEIANTYFTKNGKGISDLDKPLQYKQLANNTGYIKIGSFYKGFIEYQGQQYQQFLDSVFADIHVKGNKQIIIDLRNNEGGGDNYAEILLTYLLPESITIGGMNRIAGRTFFYKPYTVNLSDDIKMIMNNPSEFLENDTSLLIKDKYVKMMDNEGTVLASNKNQFKGDVYVLINGGTFSASDVVVAGLYKNRMLTGRKIVFVGEENGGDIYRDASCSGQSYTIQLPNSKIIVDMPFLCRGILNTKYPTKRLPDISISEDINYLIKGKDYLLDQVLQKVDK